MITVFIILLIIKWIRQGRSDEEIVALLKKRKLDGIIALRLIKALRGSPAVQDEKVKA